MLLSGEVITFGRYNDPINADPAKLLRQTRKAAGVSQRELARRAGTAQSAISRIEMGGQSPTVDYLNHLLACLGHQLQLTAKAQPKKRKRSGGDGLLLGRGKRG
jgi:transcriptional regulator with XRE-family HTH domain